MLEDNIRLHKMEGQKAMVYPFEDRIRKMERTSWLSSFCEEEEVGKRKEHPWMTSPTDTTGEHVARYKLTPSYL